MVIIEKTLKELHWKLKGKGRNVHRFPYVNQQVTEAFQGVLFPK